MRGFFKVYRNKVLRPSNDSSTGTWLNVQGKGFKGIFRVKIITQVLFVIRMILSFFSYCFAKYNDILKCVVMLGFF